jgi:ureidoacrylate peracid hydrolase
MSKSKATFMNSQPLTTRIQHASRPRRQGYSTLGLLALVAAGLGLSGVLASAVPIARQAKAEAPTTEKSKGSFGTKVEQGPPLDQTLIPDQTAVVMVDFQNNFASPQGSSYAPFAEQFRNTHMIENSVHLVTTARELGIQVIHVTEGYTDDYREVDMGNGGAFHRNAVQWQAFKSSSWGAQLYHPIRHESDIVLPDRKTMSGFGGNSLDFILKSRGIRNVAVGGFTADMCVYATLLEGFDRGYRMYAITDAVVAGSAPLTREMVGVLYAYVARPMTSQEFLAMFSRRNAGR